MQVVPVALARISLRVISGCCMALALIAAATGQAAVHYGAHNPLTEAWSVTSGDSGVNATPFAPDPDFPDVLAWQINSNASGRLRYEVAGPAASDSWRYSAHLRVVNLNDAVDLGVLLEVANGAQRFMLTFGSNAAGDTLINLNGADYPDSIDLAIAPSQTGRTDYQHVVISFDAQTDLAEVYINGQLLAANWSGASSPLQRVNFGDGATSAVGIARYARVEFNSGLPACNDGLDNDGDGLTDFNGADADCQSALDPTEGVYCPVGKDVDADGVCENIIVATELNNDPARAGWVRPTAAAGQSWQPGDEDLGAGNCEFPCPFWRITDNGTASGNLGAYQVTPAPVSNSRHWELRAEMRLRPLSSVADAVNYAKTLFVRVPVAGGVQEYGALFGTDGNGNMLLRPSGTTDSINIGPTTDYHLIRVVYDPEAASADILVDGVVVAQNSGGRFISGLTTANAFWGSGESGAVGRSHWRSVALELDPDTDGDGLPNAAEPALGTNPYQADTDDDGLVDGAEVAAGTDPLVEDSDGDGLLDGFEAASGLNPLSADADGDLDGDGLLNSEEQDAQTRPDLADTDGDGLSDGEEVTDLDTDPRSPDTDGDTLSDGEEVNLHGTNPLLADSDGDAIFDAEELIAGTDPLDADSDDDGLADGLEAPAGTNPLLSDTDGDGLLDGFELNYGFDPTVAAGAADDLDGDGLNNLAEQQAGTAPDETDTDGDGLSDAQEVNVFNSNPLSTDTDGDGLLDEFETLFGFDLNNFGDATRDTDNDGLTNAEEQDLGLDPTVADSDGDGYLDGEETYIFGTVPTRTNEPGTPLTHLTSLQFVATDQPLFDDLPEPTFVDLAPLVAEQTGGTIREGEVRTIQRSPSTLTAQDIWDEAVAQCDAYEYTAPVSSHVDACRNLTVSPTRTECINGGNVSFASRSVSCCTSAITGVIATEDAISNGCTSPFNEVRSHTITAVNNLPGGPYINPTYIDVGDAIGPRPSSDTPLPPRDYQIGAEVTQTIDVTGGITLTPGLSSVDPGAVDLYYDTQGYVRLSNSVVTPGALFSLTLDHLPRSFAGPRFDGTSSGCRSVQANSTGSCMSSRWPSFSTSLTLDINIDISADAEIWSINPDNGEQLHTTRSLFDQSLGRSYDLAALDWRIGDSLDMRFLHELPAVPEFIQQDISITNDDVFGLWDPGTKLPIPIDIPFGCFLKKISENLCITLGIPEKLGVSTNLMTFQLQIPELNSPVSQRDPNDIGSRGFNGGAPSNFSLDKVEPLRHFLNDEGHLINTVPNKFRPTFNLAALDGSAESLLDTFVLNNTDLSSDVFRYELDLDGIVCINSGGLGCLGASAGIPLVADITVDAVDLDLVMWTGWDSSLTFEPNLQALLRFSTAVEVWDSVQSQFVTVAAGEAYPVEVPVSSAGPASVLIRQPDGGVDVSVEYSFANNLFTSNSQYAVKLAAEASYMQARVGGLAGSAFEYFVGVPLQFGLLTAITEAPPIPAQTLESSYAMTAPVMNFPGPTLTIVDAGLDSDADGLEDDIENAWCSDANDADSDDDGLPDGVEDLNRNGVVDAGETDPCNADSDGDGLQDGAERGLVTPHADTDLGLFVGNNTPRIRTDPNNVDTDGDGFSDFEEIAEGSNPLSRGDCPPSACQSNSALKIILMRARES